MSKHFHVTGVRCWNVLLLLIITSAADLACSADACACSRSTAALQAAKAVSTI
jgi:hypothetical protein